MNLKGVKFLHKSEYVVLYDDHEGLVIKDMGINCRSVTNDAEEVVKTLAPRLNGRRLFYFDSMNRLDELVVKDGQFAGFEPNAPREVREALTYQGLL